MPLCRHANACRFDIFMISFAVHMWTELTLYNTVLHNSVDMHWGSQMSFGEQGTNSCETKEKLGIDDFERVQIKKQHGALHE